LTRPQVGEFEVATGAEHWQSGQRGETMSSSSFASILVVDDDQRTLMAMRELLQCLGQNLVLANSGEEALRCVLKDDFAVILLDARMPGIDGFETARLIRECQRSRHTPIIFVTGARDDLGSMFRGYEVGAVDYIVKPLIPEVLKSKISVFINLYAKNAALVKEIAEHKPEQTSHFDAQAFLTKVAEGKSISAYQKKQVIFAQGDLADSICYIQKGQIRLTVVSDHGKQAIVAVLGAGDFLGEGCLAGRPLRMTTATAMTESSVVSVEKSAMLRTLHNEPSLSELFMSYLLARNIRTEEDLVDQILNSSEKRLARVLLLLAGFGKGGKPAAVIPKISQEALAEMIGTTRPRVNFFMNKFKKLGFIEFKEGLRVHSSLINVVLHD
jgi:CRP/FNR family transcriptional regulator, cyclic AMP receptor protein